MPTDLSDRAVLARQKRLIGLVWPAGMPARDRVVLDAIPSDQRSQILNRLEAVWRADQGEPLGPLADLAGLKRAAFFNLRRAWREDSLAGLVPNERRAGRRVAVDVDDPLCTRAAELLRASPGQRNVDVAKSILEEQPLLVSGEGTHAALVALQRLERVVQHQRRALAADPEFLGRSYGQGLVVDLTAVSMVLDEDERSLAVAALLVESASGIIFGSALGRHVEGVQLECAALDEGLMFLEQWKVDLPRSRAAAPDVGLMIPSGVDTARVEESLRPHVGRLMIGKVGGFSFGQQLVQIFGPRVGRMVMNPRRTLSVDVEHFLESRVAPLVSLAEAQLIWRREVNRHNAKRLSALTTPGVLRDSVADGRLAAIIRAIREALQVGQSFPST